ncbi:hypothetical protein, partial [Xanthomonas fragariae]|uniref:hypothetical protein n=1 Tax=Xanthomonas fragariae TaxID=48664 RepID=UPI001F409818
MQNASRLQLQWCTPMTTTAMQHLATTHTAHKDLRASTTRARCSRQRSAIAFNAFRLLPHLVAVYA